MMLALSALGLSGGGGKQGILSIIYLFEILQLPGCKFKEVSILRNHQLISRLAVSPKEVQELKRCGEGGREGRTYMTVLPSSTEMVAWPRRAYFGERGWIPPPAKTKLKLFEEEFCFGIINTSYLIESKLF